MENMAFPELTFDGERFAKSTEGYPLDDVLDTCPKGLREIVGPGGKDFSGGQTQKIHFARILYHGYPLVLIDEGTSGLDPESERLVYDLLDRLKRHGTTILMITHRVATVEKADEVLILQKGGKVTTCSQADLKIDHEILSLLQD
jgi:ABC-type bacteriocin/lantibiotic exporter with double-glycine peptidase domain